MSIKLKYTAILACSVVLAMPSISSAQWGWGIVGGAQSEKVEDKNQENKTVLKDFNSTNSTGADNTSSVDNATSVDSLDVKIQSIFNESIDRVSKAADQSINEINVNFETEISKESESSKSIANTQATLSKRKDEYTDVLSQKAYSVYNHLKEKTKELDNYIASQNDLVLVANQKAIEIAKAYADSVESKSAMLVKEISALELGDISGDKGVDKAIYAMLQSGNANIDNTTLSSDQDITKTLVRDYITSGAPSLKIASK